MANGLLGNRKSRMGSWRICEKDSVSLVSRHPGDRHRNDLLGQRAASPEHTLDIGSDNSADAANSVAGNASGFAADAERGNTHFPAAVVAVTGRQRLAIAFQEFGFGRDSNRYRYSDLLRHSREAGRQVYAER